MSLALHLGLALWVRAQPDPEPARPPVSRAATVELVFTSPKAERAPAPAPPIAPTPHRERPNRETPKGEAPPRPKPEAQAPVATAPAQGPASTPGAETDQPRAKASGQLPSALLPPPHAPGPGEEGPAFSGHLTRPGDPVGDPAALRAAEGARAQKTAQGMLEDELANGRTRDGIIDPYFAREERVLQDATEHAPKFTEGKTFVHDLLSALAPAASQYARTGNPYAPGAVAEGNVETEFSSPIERAMKEQPGSQMAELGRVLAAGARMREFADGKFGVGIIATVEIRQDAAGRFLSAKVLQSSGSRVFDQHVLARAPEAIATLPAAPKEGAGIHPTGLRTVWQFEGRILYWHKVKLAALKPEDVAKYAAAGLIAALSNGYIPQSNGRMDLQTGVIEVVDLTDPQFTCRVKLLRAY